MLEKILKKMKDDLYNQSWFKVWGDVPHLGGDGWCTKCGEQFDGQKTRRIALYDFSYESDRGSWYRWDWDVVTVPVKCCWECFRLETWLTTKNCIGVGNNATETSNGFSTWINARARWMKGSVVKNDEWRQGRSRGKGGEA